MSREGFDRRGFNVRGGDELPRQNGVGLYDSGNPASPPGLMAGPDTGAVVSVEIFVEQDVIAPVRIVLEPLAASIHGAASAAVTEEGADQPLTQFMGHLKKRQFPARAGWALHPERVAVVCAQLHECGIQH